MTATWSPLVTALVPSYNGEAFLQRTLDSLAAQTWDKLEILIGDDCSTDGTAQIIAQFAASHPNVRVLSRKRNLGWSANSNDLMANASGELLFFAFHDDVVDPEYVRALVEALRHRPRAIIAYTDVELWESDGLPYIHRFTGLNGRHTSLSRGLAMLDQPEDWWVPNRGLFRAWAFKKSGGIKRNEAGEFMADWPWLLHLALLGDFVRVPRIYCHKYYQLTSLSKTWAVPTNFQWQSLFKAGQREVWNSSLPLRIRLALMAYKTPRFRGLRERLPLSLRKVLSRLL